MKLRNEFKAGIFILATLTLFISSIFFIGREKQIFAKQLDYTTSFSDVKGLSAGAPIRLGGITIGRVSDIEFVKNSSDPTIVVTMLINEKFTDRLRKDSRVMIETQGLLGDRFLGISAGTSTEVLPKGAEIPSKPDEDIAGMLDKVKTLVEKTSKIADNIDSVVVKVKDEGLPDIISASKTFSQILNDTKSGEGLLHALVYDKKGTEAIDSLGKALNSFQDSAKQVSNFIEEAKSEDNILHTLFLSKSPEGLSPQKFSEIATNVNLVLENLNKVSQSLANGSGTIGALLIDPTLYDNLIQVTDKAKRSFLLRQVVKSSLEK